MDKLAAMRAFVEICDRGTLTAAGTALGKSQPTMVRTLAALEDTLGVRLLRRTTRRIALTEQGRGYLEHCRRILDDIESAEHALTAGGAEPRGTLRVTAPVTFGQRHVAPLVLDFLARHGKVCVDLLLLDRVVNLLEEGVDLAVRIGPLPDSSLVASPVGRMRRVLVASPGLLAERGTPDHPRDLAGTPGVVFRGMSAGNVWRFTDAGRSLSVEVRPVLVVNQAPAAVAACVRGLGFGVFQAYQVASELASGSLIVLLEAHEPTPAPVSLVFSDARLMSPSLRVLIDFVRDGLRRGLEARGEAVADD